MVLQPPNRADLMAAAKVGVWATGMCMALFAVSQLSRGKSVATTVETTLKKPAKVVEGALEGVKKARTSSSKKRKKKK